MASTPSRAAAPRRARASAPGGIGNMGPGLDVLGCAVEGLRDSVEAWVVDEPGVQVVDPGHPELPRDATRHASAIAAQAVLDAADQRRTSRPVRGVALRVVKGLPLAGGQGGSAASAVAGAAAANALLDEPLDTMGVLDAALAAESVVAGRHLDNVAPCLLGGVVLVRAVSPVDLVRLRAPRGLRIVLALPDQRVRTADARALLPPAVPLPVALHQAAQMAAIVAACMTDDLALLGRALDDRIAEPARAPLLPGFVEAKEAALRAGALGCGISGAGPTSFAFVRVTDEARVAEAMRDAYARGGVRCTTRVTTISATGVIVEAA